MKKLFLLITLSLFASAAMAADPIWFSCHFTAENGNMISLGTSTDRSGNEIVVVQNEVTKTVTHSGVPKAMNEFRLDDGIYTTIADMPYGKIVLTQDTRQLIITGILTKRQYNGKDQKVKNVQSLLDGDAVILDCRFE